MPPAPAISQAEIFTTTSYGNEVFLFRGHKGFVRMALRHRARLVPVLSMGEWELMDNVSWPRTQAFTRKLLGFPVPFAPYGEVVTTSKCHNCCHCLVPVPFAPNGGATTASNHCNRQ